LSRPEGTGYDASVLKWFAWRLLDLATLSFAALGFFYVPLGQRTGFEHARAIATSAQVRELAIGVVEATRAFRANVRQRLRLPFELGSGDEHEPESTPGAP
jgi:hypothetical protein